MTRRSSTSGSGLILDDGPVGHARSLMEGRAQLVVDTTGATIEIGPDMPRVRTRRRVLVTRAEPLSAGAAVGPYAWSKAAAHGGDDEGR